MRVSQGANKSNFKKAINAHLAKACASITPDPSLKSYPAAVAVEQPGRFRSQAMVDKDNKQKEEPYETLVHAGVLSAKDGMLELSSFGSHDKIPARIYSLTAVGEKSLVKEMLTVGLCAAHYKVDEVLRFTEPTSGFGAPATQVWFTFSPGDVADWAKSSAVTRVYPRLTKDLAQHQQGQMALILTGDGWVSAEDLMGL